MRVGRSFEDSYGKGCSLEFEYSEGARSQDPSFLALGQRFERRRSFSGVDYDLGTGEEYY